MTCICINEPRGEYGLEGYVLNEEYPLQVFDHVPSKIYWVHLNNNHDAMGKHIFNKFFKLKEEYMPKVD